MRHDAIKNILPLAHIPPLAITVPSKAAIKHNLLPDVQKINDVTRIWGASVLDGWVLVTALTTLEINA